MRKVFGGLLNRAGERIEQGQSGLGIAAVTEGLGPPQGAVAGVIASLLGRLVAVDGLPILLAGEVAFGQVIVGHRPAVGLIERFDRPVVSAQQVQANAQPDAAGRGMILAGLQFAHRVAEDRILGEVAGDGFLHLPDFARTERVVSHHRLLQIELDGLCHRKLLLKSPCTLEPAKGVEPLTPALRMRCSAD